MLKPVEKDKLKTIGFSSDRKLESHILKLQKENNKKMIMKKRKQITSIIKGCSLVQFGHNCAVLCNHLYRVTQASRFYAN